MAPQRNGDPPFPTIWLQQPDSTWKPLTTAKFPVDRKFAYGSVRVADFDGDGHPDIALACHFGEAYVFYGDGKGNFTRYVKLPRINPRITARSIVVADFNGDGRPDLATVTELDLDMATKIRQKTGLVQIMLNLPDGWKTVDEGFPTAIQADWLSAADIDKDGLPELLLTSRMQGIQTLFFHGWDKAQRWTSFAEDKTPINAFVTANAAGSLDKFDVPDVVLCYQQFDPQTSTVATQACTIYHFHDASGKPSLVPSTSLLFKKTEYDNMVKCVAVGDIDGDGLNDIAFATADGTLRVFLQSADGSFLEDKSADLDLHSMDPFDIHIADLHHNGKGEIVVAGSARGKAHGAVMVFAPKARGTAVAAKPGK